jgi:Protein of unknown function (DUF2934)
MRSRLAKVQPETQREVREIREPDAEEIRRMIAEAAYYRAEKRGFTPGAEEEDWCEAEREVRDSLRTIQARI